MLLLAEMENALHKLFVESLLNATHIMYFADIMQKRTDHPAASGSLLLKQLVQSHIDYVIGALHCVLSAYCAFLQGGRMVSISLPQTLAEVHVPLSAAHAGSTGLPATEAPVGGRIGVKLF